MRSAPSPQGQIFPFVSSAVQAGQAGNSSFKEPAKSLWPKRVEEVMAPGAWRPAPAMGLVQGRALARSGSGKWQPVTFLGRDGVPGGVHLPIAQASRYVGAHQSPPGARGCPPFDAHRPFLVGRAPGHGKLTSAPPALLPRLFLRAKSWDAGPFAGKEKTHPCQPGSQPG